MIFCVDFLGKSSACTRFYLNDLSVLGMKEILLVVLKLASVCISLNWLLNELVIPYWFYLDLYSCGLIEICDSIDNYNYF